MKHIKEILFHLKTIGIGICTGLILTIAFFIALVFVPFVWLHLFYHSVGSLTPNFTTWFIFSIILFLIGFYMKVRSK